MWLACYVTIYYRLRTETKPIRSALCSKIPLVSQTLRKLLFLVNYKTETETSCSQFLIQVLIHMYVQGTREEVLILNVYIEYHSLFAC